MTFAGVDIGTSGLKVSLLDDAGAVVDERAASYATSTPRPGWCELDPEAWLRAYRTVAGGLDSVTAIGFTGQMHGVVLTDEDNVPLRPAVLWPDRRASEMAERWERSHVLDDLDTPVKPGYAAAILAWLSTNEPDVIAATKRVWFTKDWVRARLCDDPVPITERSDAAGSLLWDPRTGMWSAEAARLAGIETGVLAELRGSTELAGTIAGVPAIVGGADTATALEAYRAIEPRAGSVYVNAGSGCQVLRPFATRPARSRAAECVFADTGVGWYAMRALDTRDVPDGGVLAEMVAVAVAGFAPDRVVVGGGAAHDPVFRRELGTRLSVPARCVEVRSLSACGAALLAATAMGRRIGLRHDTVEVSRR